MILKLVSDAGGGASASATENAALREQVRFHFTTFTSFLAVFTFKEEYCCFSHFGTFIVFQKLFSDCIS